MVMSQNGLSERQRNFCREYLKSHVASRAYVAAYGPMKNAATAESCASRLLGSAKVQAEIGRLWRLRDRRSEIKADLVIQGLAKIAFADPRALLDADGNLKPLAELDDDTAATLASFELVAGDDGATIKRVKSWDKVRALEMLAKHFGLVGPETVRHMHSVVHFTAEQLAGLTDAQLVKVESAYALLAEVEQQLQNQAKLKA